MAEINNNNNNNCNNNVNTQLPQSKFGLGSDNSDLIVLILKYFRIVALVFFVWMIGYFGFSLAWILVASFVYLWRERTKNLRELKSEMIRAVQLDEKNAILARIDEVPSWVYFPDKERAEWVNKILKQVWPYFCRYMTGVIKTVIEPIIQDSIPQVVGSFKFDKIDLGDIPPRIGSVKVYTERVLENEIIIDLEVLYAGDAKIKVQTKKILCGIKSIQFHGELRIVLKPLCDQIPLFGAMTAFFLRTPSFDFDLTDIANALDIPILNEGLKTTVSDILGKMLVLPNRLVIPIIADPGLVDMYSLKAPHPKGVLRLYVYKAFNLKRADVNILGQGKSDPYVKIYGCGNKEFKTKIIQNNLNPEWNEVFHLTIEDLEGNNKLFLDVYDEDIKNDDFIGGLTIDVQQIISKGSDEGIYTLKNVKHGQIKLKFEWFYLSNRAIDIVKAKKYSKDTSISFPLNIPLPVSILIIHLKHANGLPNVIKKGGGTTEPNPVASLSVANTIFTSGTQINTTNPHWDENFFFMLENAEHETLHLKINDKKTEKELCFLDYNLSDLLQQKDLTLNRQFELESIGNLSKVTMALSIKFFSTDDPEDDDTNVLNTSETQSTTKTNNEITKQPSKENTPESEIVLNRTPSKQNNVSQLPTTTPTLSKLLVAPSTQINNENEGLRQRSVHQISQSEMHLGYGKIQLTLHYKLQNNVFSVTVHGCKSLQSVHATNLPDPYVRLFLLPDQKSKQRTRSIKDTLNPEYEDTFEWPIRYEELKKRVLDISIKNEKPFLSSEKVYMGELSIDLSKLDLNQPIRTWFDIREKNESKLIVDRI